MQTTKSNKEILRGNVFHVSNCKKIFSLFMGPFQLVRNDINDVVEISISIILSLLMT